MALFEKIDVDVPYDMVRWDDFTAFYMEAALTKGGKWEDSGDGGGGADEEDGTQRGEVPTISPILLQ